MDTKKHELCCDTRESKIVRDPVHGTIHLDKLAVKIIDTPYFQRLRNIKQLSFVDYVYPGATHTSFAHSIGVYHLACQIIKEIENKPPPDHARMTSEDKMCVRVAALCRGLGHGPFGHAYTRIAKHIVDMEFKQHNGTEVEKCIRHRDISAALTELMFRNTRYDLKEHLGDTEELREEHMELIKTLITGNIEAMLPKQKKKRYMFQIISDLGSGLHVGEWDYCNRDAKACGVSERFQYDRALNMARVVEIPNGEFVLAYHDYDAVFLYNMFNARFTLYQNVFRQRVVVAVELIAKVDFVPIKAFDDLRDDTKLDAFLALDDNVLFKIRDSSAGQYKKAQVLIKQVQNRKLYKMLKDIPTEVVNGETQDQVTKKRKETRERVDKVVKLLELKMQDQIETEEVVFNYGFGIEDPIDQFYFYSKDDEKTGKRLADCDACKKPSVRPSVFEECHLRVYYKPNAEMETENLRVIFELLWSDVEACKEDLPATFNG